MAAKSGGDFRVVGRGGASGGGNSAAAKRASSQPSGSGQPILAAAARFKYSCTVLTESEQLRAICRCSSFSSFLSRRTSLILRVDFLLAGKRFSLQGPGSLTRRGCPASYLWKTFRGKPNSVPGLAKKCSDSARNSCSASPRNGVRNHPGMLFGFSPESCSPSARNRVRVAPEYAVDGNTRGGPHRVSSRARPRQYRPGHRALCRVHRGSRPMFPRRSVGSSPARMMASPGRHRAGTMLPASSR